jgi:hypothetical protein
MFHLPVQPGWVNDAPRVHHSQWRCGHVALNRLLRFRRPVCDDAHAGLCQAILSRTSMVNGLVENSPRFLNLPGDRTPPPAGCA